MRNLEALSLGENHDGRGSLALSRKEGESIVIEDVLITVQKVRGNRATLLIRANKDVRIARAELLHLNKGLEAAS